MFRKLIEKLKKLFLRSHVGYINGPDTLPPPMTPEEEERVLSAMESDPSVRSVLIERNLRLVVYIAKKFDGSSVPVEDLISIGTIGLIKAINTFRTDKNIKLAPYASRCIENEILMHLRKIQHQKNEFSLDEPLNIDWDGNELLLSDVLGTDEDAVMADLENEEERRTVREAVERLSQRERQIIELRYGLTGKEEMTQKEVADLLGISQSYISRLEKRILDKLKEEITLLMF